MRNWILVGHTPFEVDLLEWAEFFEGGRRVLKQEYVGKIFISTVFLGIDHNFGMSGHLGSIPVLFETMVFTNGEPSAWDYHEERTRSWDEAMKIHRRIVRAIKAGKGP